MPVINRYKPTKMLRNFGQTKMMRPKITAKIADIVNVTDTILIIN